MTLADFLLHEAGHPDAKGDCFVAAFRWLYAHGDEKSVLVHAEAIGQGPIEGVPFAHAYCVRDGMVHDTSNGRDISAPVEIYELIGGISAVGNKRVYSRIEAIEKAHESGHYGPWDLETSSGF